MKKILFTILAVLFALALSLPAMAATTYASTQSQSYNLFQPGINGQGGSVTVDYEATATLGTNDVIQMCKVPPYVKVTDVLLVVDDLDSGTTITLDVGYGTDVDYFIDGSTVGQAGGLARAAAATAFPLALTAADTIDILVAAKPTGGGTGTLSLTVWYTGNP